jgi:hypothetical protein
MGQCLIHRLTAQTMHIISTSALAGNEPRSSVPQEYGKPLGLRGKKFVLLTYCDVSFWGVKGGLVVSTYLRFIICTYVHSYI